MKIMFLLLSILSCGFIKIAMGQKNVQFIYIGSERRIDAGVLITSAPFQGDYLNGKDSRFTKIYYTDQGILDTIKTYISRSKWVSSSDTFKSENGKIDTAELLDAYKITGVNTSPLYVKGKDCLKLFASTMQHLVNLGLFNTAGYNAIDHLMFQCHLEYLHRDLIREPAIQIKTSLIIDTPRILVKSNN